MDKNYFDRLFKINDDYTLPRRVTLSFLVQNDKYYPGLKLITFEPYNGNLYSYNGNLYFNIQYNSIMNLFECEKNPKLMKGIYNYLMSNENILIDKIVENSEIFERYQLGLVETRPKNKDSSRQLTIVLDVSSPRNLHNQLLEIFETIAIRGNEYIYLLNEITDLYH